METSQDSQQITPADAGCWLDGAMGWHNTYRVIDIAIAYGWHADAPVLVKAMSRDIDSYIYYITTDSEGQPDLYEHMHEMATEATDYLQSLAPEGYVFEWDMGELSLILGSELEWWEK